MKQTIFRLLCGVGLAAVAHAAGGPPTAPSLASTASVSSGSVAAAAPVHGVVHALAYSPGHAVQAVVPYVGDDASGSLTCGDFITGIL